MLNMKYRIRNESGQIKNLYGIHVVLRDKTSSGKLLV